ncbi:hypothetical protein H4S02_005269 [Coemansia sp. RSA 2611]|nr:hypothetical protein H4S01_004711 [Coemansia sp. RSA 2610]KAJ2383507.1 hypothetical protein H4S02_005269 [Coemansia sp. RSA 2611]
MSAERILGASPAANIVAEVARDVIERSSDTYALYRLGRRVAAARAAQGPRALDGLLQAAADPRVANGAGALALGAGVAVELGERGHAQRMQAAWARVMGGGDHVRAQLVGAAGEAGDGQLLGALAAAVPAAAVGAVAGEVHALAVAALLQCERGHEDAARARAVVCAVEALAQRVFVDDAYVAVADATRWAAWPQCADALACVHWHTLRAGRAGSDAFRRATTLLVAFAQRGAAARVDAAVRAACALQPCLRFVPQGHMRVAPARERAVLFYLDLLEHVAELLPVNTLQLLVVPLAAHYAQRAPSEWFESAHALVLALLEQREPLRELAPWYADLLLELYPDRGISADLLRIAYPAAVRALAAEPSRVGCALAADCVQRLFARLDAFAGSGAVRAVRRREVLGAVAELLAAVPLELLPRLMRDLELRVVDEREWNTRRVLADEIQDVVLERADLSRKPALSAWAWQLRATVNNSISKI